RWPASPAAPPPGPLRPAPARSRTPPSPMRTRHGDASRARPARRSPRCAAFSRTRGPDCRARRPASAPILLLLVLLRRGVSLGLFLLALLDDLRLGRGGSRGRRLGARRRGLLDLRDDDVHEHHLGIAD